jgi:transcription antitermination protein NusB
VSDLPEFDAANRPPGQVVQHQPATSERSLARRIALQILYEVDSVGHDAVSVMTIHMQARQVAKKPARYVRRLIEGVTAHLATLDDAIHRLAPDWPIDQMSIVDRNILRMGIYEMAILGHAPVGVAIDEAVGLATLFGAENTPGFVNGVLGTLAENETMMDELRAHGSGESSEDDEE